MFNSTVEEEWVMTTIQAVMVALAQNGTTADGELVAREVLSALKILRKYNEKSVA
jgi:hypothetical protein